MSKIGVAVVGFGTIGMGVVEILQNNRELIQQRTGVDIELKYIIDLDITTKRDVEVKEAELITDYKTALNDPEVDVIVELVGGINVAYQIIEATLKAGKNAVTANKALLAEKGDLLFKLADERAKTIGFEGSVAGGIPIIRVIHNALSADNIQAIYGIVNGTTNYILTKMYEENLDFDIALKQAQELGFAEADPTLDIEGYDAAHKMALLAALAFNTTLNYDKIYVEGIVSVNLDDVNIAGRLGYILKLLAIAKIDEDNKIEIRVHPALAPKDNQLAFVRNEYNAILVESKYLGSSMYYGKGAGSLPTATAVVADIISVAKFKDMAYKTSKYTKFNDYEVKEIGEIKSRYYIRFNVLDKVGVLSDISGIFGNNNISIASVIQEERSATDFVPLILTTHTAIEKNIVKALDEIENKDYTDQRGVMIRILE